MVPYFTFVLWRFKMWFKINEKAHKWPYKCHTILSYEGKPCSTSFNWNSWQCVKPFDPEETAGTAKFWITVDKYFDCLNVRNATEHITEIKPFLKPHYLTDDARLNF